MTDDPLRATISLRGVLFGVNDDVLLVKRASDGGWELPGGRLDPGEDVLEGLRREIAEETALAPTVDEPVHNVTWRNDADRGRFATYFRCSTSERAVTLSEEHTDYRWTTPGEARETLSDPQGRAVERALATRRPTAGAADQRGIGATLND
jgi:8-oxo-dGTP pyrophosphatase MutT (NUDIX family)